MTQLTEMLLACCRRALRDGARFADARALVAESLSLTIQDGQAEKLSAYRSAGVGVRVLADGAWGMASADALDERAVERARLSALAAARSAAGACRDPGVVADVQPVQAVWEMPANRPLDDWSLRQKIDHLTALERAGASAAGTHCLNSILGYSQGRRTLALANSYGTQLTKTSPGCRVGYTITAAVDDVRQQAHELKAHVGGLELLTDLQPEQLSIKAADRVLRQCRSRPAPPGAMPIVFHPSITGLLAHEALGHNAEADSYYTGQSILEGKLGERIAAPDVTIVDDPTFAGAYGTYAYDDEGVPAEPHVIIDRGVFRGLLHNLESAARFGVAPNGSGRAEDHAAQPLARMSNTFVQAKPDGATLDQMIRSIDRGLYLAEGHEGYVFPERGQFVCRADSARLIEKGRLGDWLRDVSVSGLILETLARIEMVGRDFEMVSPGICDKLGQGVRTDCGGPHVKVSEMVVGGME